MRIVIDFYSNPEKALACTKLQNPTLDKLRIKNDI